MRRLTLSSLLLILLLSRPVLAYPVGPALPMEELEKQADLIIKATAVETKAVEDPSFRKLPGYVAASTRLKVITVLKGDAKAMEIDFRHYASDPAMMVSHSPQYYNFEAGATYILLAKADRGAGGRYRQLWDNHNSKQDQGQIRCGNDKPVKDGLGVKEAVWDELTNLLDSGKPGPMTYAIGQLDSMSGKSDGSVGFGTLDDFPREKVLDAIGQRITHKNAAVATTAIGAAGRRSPFLSDDYAMGWLATVGKGKLLARGHGTYPDKWDNPDARKLRKQLVEAAEKGVDNAARAKAVRALGLVKDEELLPSLRKWSEDIAPEVRASAALLWADFPGREAEEHLSRLSTDLEQTVRARVATAVGVLQSPALLTSVIGKLLADPEEQVRTAAAVTAVSFSPKDSAEILQLFRNHPDYHASFINALALGGATPYLDDLAEVVLSRKEPDLHFVSQIPTYTSWQILKEEIEKRPIAELKSGKLDRYLDALDHPADIGSGPYQEMYRFYWEKGLKERAAKFREMSMKHVKGYDIDNYFKRIDGRAQ